jgi:hypothetical protein
MIIKFVDLNNPNECDLRQYESNNKLISDDFCKIQKLSLK